MGGSDRGMGEPVTPHKTRLSLPSQASGKLTDEQEKRNGAQAGRRSRSESGFLKPQK